MLASCFKFHSCYQALLLKLIVADEDRRSDKRESYPMSVQAGKKEGERPTCSQKCAGQPIDSSIFGTESLSVCRLYILKDDNK